MIRLKRTKIATAALGLFAIAAFGVGVNNSSRSNAAEDRWVANDPVVAAAAPSQAQPKSAGNVTEVTGLDKAAEKLSVAGAHAATNSESFEVTSDSRVFRLGGPDSEHFIVTPAFMKVVEASIAQGDTGETLASFGAEIDVARLKDAKTRSLNGRAMLASTYWQIDTAGCLPYLYINEVRMDACVRQEKLMNDGVSNQDYWAMHSWGTVYTTNNRKATQAWVQLQRSGTSSAFTMMDKQPGSSSSGNCQSIQLGLNVGSGYGISYSTTYNRCDTWNPFYFGNPTTPYFKNMWSGDVRNGGSRQVAASMAVYTAEWAYPVWYLTWGFTGCVVQVFNPDNCNSGSTGG